MIDPAYIDTLCDLFGVNASERERYRAALRALVADAVRQARELRVNVGAPVRSEPFIIEDDAKPSGLAPRSERGSSANAARLCRSQELQGMTMRTVIVWNDSRIVIRATNKGNEDDCRQRLQRMLRHKPDDPRWQIIPRNVRVDVPDRMLTARLESNAEAP